MKIIKAIKECKERKNSLMRDSSWGLLFCLIFDNCPLYGKKFVLDSSERFLYNLR